MRSIRRKVCVFTGTRAEYGLLKHLMRALVEDEAFELQLVVAGSHLLPQQGHTLDEILADGFVPDAQVDLVLASNSPVSVAKSTALGLLGCADAFDRLQPDLLVVLGDRFEALAAVQAAYLQRIPVAHLHGGELTLGALDDGIRHAITKLSALHFVAHADYGRRVAQLGEEPWRIEVVGPMVGDALCRMAWLDRQTLADGLGVSVDKPWYLITWHPETLGSGEDLQALEAIYAALVEQAGDGEWVWTYPNADAGGQEILNWLLAQAARDPRLKAVPSLGQQRYLSLMRESRAVLGNSSSGLLEAPWLGVPTVNVGQRQAGRLRAETVVDCAVDAVAVRNALSLVQAQERRALSSMQAPSGKILAKLREIDWQALVHKGFVDWTPPPTVY